MAVFRSAKWTKEKWNEVCGYYEDEHCIVEAIKTHLLTLDQKQWLFEKDFSISSFSSGSERYSLLTSLSRKVRVLKGSFLIQSLDRAIRIILRRFLIYLIVVLVLHFRIVPR